MGTFLSISAIVAIEKNIEDNIQFVFKKSTISTSSCIVHFLQAMLFFFFLKVTYNRIIALCPYLQCCEKVSIPHPEIVVFVTIPTKQI